MPVDLGSNREGVWRQLAENFAALRVSAATAAAAFEALAGLSQTSAWAVAPEIPDDLQCTDAEWNAKIDAVLADAQAWIVAQQEEPRRV